MSESDLRMDQRVHRSMRDVAREAFVTGLAVFVPGLITLVVLATAFNYVYVYVDLFSDAILQLGPRLVLPVFDGVLEREQLVEGLTPLLLLWTILVVGLLVNASPYGERAGRSGAACGETESRPAEFADRDPEERVETEGRPAELADRDPAERDETEGRSAANDGGTEE